MSDLDAAIAHFIRVRDERAPSDIDIEAGTADAPWWLALREAFDGVEDAVRDLRERHTTALRDRDALQAMVDCCRELVAEFVKPSTRNSVASAMHGELAEIVGYPPVLDEATRETP